MDQEMANKLLLHIAQYSFITTKMFGWVLFGVSFIDFSIGFS